MFSVIFEVHPKQEKVDLYLDLAMRLRPVLEGIDGFVDNERFESSRRPGWILSHSTWRDEKSVVRWRTVAQHHDTQQRGRDEVFQDYHLRVGEIVADTAPPPGASIVEQRLDETEIGVAKFATLTEVLRQHLQSRKVGPLGIMARSTVGRTVQAAFVCRYQHPASHRACGARLRHVRSARKSPILSRDLDRDISSWHRLTRSMSLKALRAPITSATGATANVRSCFSRFGLAIKGYPEL